MNTEANFKQIEHENSNTVVSFDNGATFKISKFMEKLNSFFVQSVLNSLSEQLKQTGLGNPPGYGGTWTKGIKAEILEPKSVEWKKGKIRMRVILEFCPDEPEEMKSDIAQQNGSSLDDIRQTIS
ncbi:hypothetical protein IQ255_09415 [Pleurocapsales cyanobacterium LEGE 10410]|nr:hypothetical protein [Pleurocapsales cyanobacterium LEGE 10410]